MGMLLALTRERPRANLAGNISLGGIPVVRPV
jgi:hypothetical protein